jgi:hypothetical protein
VKPFLIVKAVISFASGLVLVAVPGLRMALYGVTLDAPAAMMARLVGALLIGLGVLCLSTRSMAVLGDKKGVLLSLFVADTLGSVVFLVGQLGGFMNALGWVDVAIWLLLALGLGYFRFLSKAAT